MRFTRSLVFIVLITAAVVSSWLNSRVNQSQSLEPAPREISLFLDATSSSALASEPTQVVGGLETKLPNEDEVTPKGLESSLNKKVFTLRPVADSQLSGIVSISQLSDTQVSITVQSPEKPTQAYQLAIVQGTCEQSGAVLYELEPFISGYSTTSLDVPAQELIQPPAARSLLVFETEPSQAVLCGRVDP